MVFPVVMYGCESWTIKKADHQRIDAFELWCWRRLLKVPWTATRSNQSILKEISLGCSLEGLMLKLKLHLSLSQLIVNFTSQTIMPCFLFSYTRLCLNYSPWMFIKRSAERVSCLQPIQRIIEKFTADMMEGEKQRDTCFCVLNDRKMILYKVAKDIGWKEQL